MKDKEILDLLIEKARKVLNTRNISKHIKSGMVSVAIKSKGGNIYTGVCIDT